MGQKQCCTDHQIQHEAQYQKYFQTNQQQVNKNNTHQYETADDENIHQAQQNYEKVQNEYMNDNINNFEPDDDMQQSQLQLKVEKLKQMGNYAQTLVLKVLSSISLDKGQQYIINPLGLKTTERQQQDGIVYFGSKKRNASKTENNSIVINDIKIPVIHQDPSENHRGRHFKIEYSLQDSCYKIQDLGIGFGVFYKLDAPLILQDSYLLNLGLIFVIVSLTPNLNDSIVSNENQSNKNIPANQLHLKLTFYGENFSDKRGFECGCQSITVGRSQKNTVTLNDHLTSKVQCTIEYNYEDGWILYDGDKQKPSTNGNWLYIQNEKRIYSGMIFKANQSLFQASLL